MNTIGAKIDALHALREEKRQLEELLKAKAQEIDIAENELIELMDKQNITKSTGSKATVSISTSVRPSVEDWDAFYAFIHRHKYYHLLERRPSVTGCRELFDHKGAIPGVVPFTQRKLNIRSV
jgi:hypothetical protein